MDQPQPEWNVHFQRYLLLQWNHQYQRHYWAHHDGQAWLFFDWHRQGQVAQQPQVQQQHQRTDSVQTVRVARAGPGREGTTVYGNYNCANPAPNSHFESLDHSFYVRDASFFQEGKVFAILFTEPAGANAANAANIVTDYNTAFSRVQYNELAYTQVRRFMIVMHKREHCYAIPIFTYGNQGTKKHGVVPSEHAIAYSYNLQPELLPGESQLSKKPICVVMNPGEKYLSKASRVYFGIHHPIQYNVKVKDLGYVHRDSMTDLFGYWNMENGGTQQTNSVTNQGFVGTPNETPNEG